MWDRVFLTRPMLHVPAWTMYFLGSQGARTLGDGAFWRWGLSLSEARGLVLLSLLLSAVYILNQLVDAPVDEANDKLYLVPRGLISRKSAALQAGLMAGLAEMLAFLWASPVEGLLVTVGLVLGAAYSLPPVRLKARPVWDILANATAFGGVAYLLGWVGEGAAWGTEAAAHASPYVLAVGAITLVSTLEDLAGDAREGLRTSAVRFGEARVRWGAAALALAALPIALLLREWPGALWTLGGAPLYVWLSRRGGIGRGFMVNQLAARGIVLLAIPGCVSLAGMVGGTALASRVYYRRRFGIAYPRMRLAKTTMPQTVPEVDRLPGGQ